MHLEEKIVKIGFIGTGLMGTPMARRLAQHGFNVIAYNRTQSKLIALQKDGIDIASSPVEVLEQADCIILMVTNANAIADLILSRDMQPRLANRGVIQMSTIAPHQSQDIGRTVIALGGDYLEAPVLGSIPQATDGRLIVMVGSTRECFETYRPVLECFGPDPMWMGDIGSAATAKLAMNQLIGSLTAAFALSLGMIQRTGIDVEQFMTIVRQSALYAPTFDKKLQRMCDRNFDNPNFPTKHLLKDMALFTETAEAMGLDSRLSDSVRQIAQWTSEQGFADADYSALYETINPPAS